LPPASTPSDNLNAVSNQTCGGIEFRRQLIVASGYAELEMSSTAHGELDRIAPIYQKAPETLAARLHIYEELRLWERARVTSTRSRCPMRWQKAQRCAQAFTVSV
jgi:hypothetical protein